MRRLVVCCDGTWNTPDRKDGGVFAPSNVVTAARAVLPVAPDGTSQLVCYDRGVGTDDILDKLTGGAFGVGLSRHVRSAYLFLVHNYVPGDEIYFFGFSRGAYTARSTAGLIRKVGLLSKAAARFDLDAWKIYRNHEGGPDSAEAQNFRDSISRWPIPIRFIGVWDTVGALGIPGLLNFIGRRRFQFHDVALSRSVEYAYQALAIDEKRRFFRPTLWEQHPEAPSMGQVMEQAWFPGVHMDAGGGYKDAGLSDGALRWLLGKAHESGLALDAEFLADFTHPDALGVLHESRGFPYTLIPAFARPIGQGVPGEMSVNPGGSSREVLHETARTRYAKDAAYRPANLVEYLEREVSLSLYDE